jgi:hypothetical protein
MDLQFSMKLQIESNRQCIHGDNTLQVNPSYDLHKLFKYIMLHVCICCTFGILTLICRLSTKSKFQLAKSFVLLFFGCFRFLVLFGACCVVFTNQIV